MSMAIRFGKAIFLIALGLAFAYSLMLPDPKGIGLFVLAISFSVLTTLVSLVIAFVFRKSKIKFVHYIIIVSNISNLVMTFYWLRSEVKFDAFVLLMLMNHVIGLIAGAESLFKVFDKNVHTTN